MPQWRSSVWDPAAGAAVAQAMNDCRGHRATLLLFGLGLLASLSFFYFPDRSALNVTAAVTVEDAGIAPCLGDPQQRRMNTSVSALGTETRDMKGNEANEAQKSILSVFHELHCQKKAQAAELRRRPTQEKKFGDEAQIEHDNRLDYEALLLSKAAGISLMSWPCGKLVQLSCRTGVRYPGRPGCAACRAAALFCKLMALSPLSTQRVTGEPGTPGGLAPQFSRKVWAQVVRMSSLHRYLRTYHAILTTLSTFPTAVAGKGCPGSSDLLLITHGT